MKLKTTQTKPRPSLVGCVLCKFRLLLLGPILQVFLYISTSLTFVQSKHLQIEPKLTSFLGGLTIHFIRSTLPKYGSFGLKALIMIRFIGYLFPDRWAPIDWRNMEESRLCFNVEGVIIVKQL